MAIVVVVELGDEVGVEARTSEDRDGGAALVVVVLLVPPLLAGGVAFLLFAFLGEGNGGD